MKERTVESVYRFIQEYIQLEGFPPSQREIAHGCNLNKTTITKALETLEVSGKIERNGRKPRAIRIMPSVVSP
jgi:repressor LexA